MISGTSSIYSYEKIIPECCFGNIDPTNFPLAPFEREKSAEFFGLIPVPIGPREHLETAT